MFKRKKSIILKNTVYIPSFLINLVFGARTRVTKIHFNSKKKYLYIKRKIFYHVKYVNSLPFIQYNEVEDLIDQTFAIFKISTIELRKFATYWHKIIDYAGPKAVKYLQNTIEGIKI